MIDNKNQTDEELVALAQKSDYTAFEELVGRYEGKIYGHVVRLLGNREDAEDALQETFLNAFRSLNNFRGESSFSTWIYRISTNNALMKIRKRKKEEGNFDEELPPPNMLPLEGGHGFLKNPGDAFIEKELLEKLDKTIKKLPEKYRTIFLLRDVEEFSTLRTAEILGISEALVKTRLHRARIFLKDALSRSINKDVLKAYE